MNVGECHRFKADAVWDDGSSLRNYAYLWQRSRHIIIPCFCYNGGSLSGDVCRSPPKRVIAVAQVQQLLLICLLEAPLLN